MKTVIDFGINDRSRAEVVKGLSRFLADSYILYLKTQNFHWNVVGPQFLVLHTMFESQYSELATAIDRIAERIRALGYKAPGTFSEFIKLTSIKEPMENLKASEMVYELVKDQEVIVLTARSMFNVIAESLDEATADLLTQRMQVHEKNGWMLRSMLD